MKIVASGDIGDLGPAQGAAITYYWNPIYNFLGLLPWLLLVLGFALFPENRNPRALWILLPVLLFKVLWTGFAIAVDMPSEANAMFVYLIDCLLVGFALVWLLGERIGNRNRFVTWLLAGLIFAAACGVILINIGFGNDAIQISIIIGLSIGILMLSFPPAALLCRRKFGPVRFFVWMAVCVIFTTIILFTGIMLIQVLVSGIPVFLILLQILVVSLIYAGILVAGLLPFEILWFKNAFWRKRFEAVTGLRTRPAPEPVEAFEMEPPPNE